MAQPPKKDEKEAPVNASLDDEASAGAGEGGEGGGKSKKMMFIIIGVVVLLLAGGGAAAYFTGMLDKVLGKAPPATEGVEHAAAEGEHGAVANECVKDEQGKEVCAPPGAKFLKIPDMIVNLNSEDGTPRYLRLAVQLEFKSAADMAAVEQVMPRVIDQFQTYLRELRVKDLRGSAGIYRLQIELLARVNQAAYPIEVQDVLFQEILIQ